MSKRVTKAELEAKVSELLDRVNHHHGEAGQLRREKAEMNRVLTGAQGEVTRLESMVGLVRAHIRNRLSVKYEVDPDYVKTVCTPEGDAINVVEEEEVRFLRYLLNQLADQ